MPAKIFVLDTNVFIEAARRYYAFDIVPAFWNVLLKHAKKGQIISIDKVREEIKRGKGPLVEWVNGPFCDYFMPTDTEEILDAYRQLIEWSHNEPQYLESAKREFAESSNADAWVIAYAMHVDGIVVTQELYSPEIKRKIPIPNVCKDFDIPYMDTFEMLRNLNVQIKCTIW